MVSLEVVRAGSNFSSSVAQAMIKLIDNNSSRVGYGNTLYYTSEIGPTGNDGADGNGIVSATNNGDGTFTLTFDDGTTFTTDDLTGTGPQGADGDSAYEVITGGNQQEGPGLQGETGLQGWRGVGGVTNVGDGLIIDGTGTQGDIFGSLPSGGTENQVLGITDGVPGWIDNSGTNTNLNTYSGENLNGDYYSNEHIIVSGNVSGDLNPATVNSGSPMDPITVPNGKIYNVKVLYNYQSGANHKSAFRIDNQPIWGNDSSPGLLNFTMHEGQTLTHVYGVSDGYHGSYSDSYYVRIEVFR